MLYFNLKNKLYKLFFFNSINTYFKNTYFVFVCKNYTLGKTEILLLKNIHGEDLVETVCWEVQNRQLLHFLVVRFCSQANGQASCSSNFFNLRILSHPWKQLSPCTQLPPWSADEMPPLGSTVGSGKEHLCYGSLAICPHPRVQPPPH